MVQISRCGKPAFIQKLWEQNALYLKMGEFRPWNGHFSFEGYRFSTQKVQIRKQLNILA